MAGQGTTRLRGLSAMLLVTAALSACASPGSLTPAEAGLHGPLLPTRLDQTRLVAFSNSPFPFHGTAPGAAKPFMDVNDNGRLGHSSMRNGILWEDQTYNDKRSLLFIPRGFDPRRPAVLVLFLHGNEATLERDVLGRQQVARQVAQSGLNAVLVAPQLAVDAKDSSAGRFWQPGFFRAYLHEAAGRLAELYGNQGIEPVFDRMPVALVAYSGGYLPAAYALKVGGARGRVTGVVLLDALYGDLDSFEPGIGHRGGPFFVSAYSRSSRDGNLQMQALLGQRGVPIATSLGSSLEPGFVTFIDAGDVPHTDFVTQAFAPDPLAAILSRIPGRSRGANGPMASAAEVVD